MIQCAYYHEIYIHAPLGIKSFGFNVAMTFSLPPPSGQAFYILPNSSKSNKILSVFILPNAHVLSAVTNLRKPSCGIPEIPGPVEILTQVCAAAVLILAIYARKAVSLCVSVTVSVTLSTCARVGPRV